MADVIRRDGLREEYEPRAWTCPGCGWRTKSVEHEQHTCPTPLDAEPDVIRRDGLREAVSLRTRLERERDVLERLAHHPCPCPRDTPVPEVAAVDAIIDHLARVLDAVPDATPADDEARGLVDTTEGDSDADSTAERRRLMERGDAPGSAGVEGEGRVLAPRSQPDAAFGQPARTLGRAQPRQVVPDVPPDPPAADREALVRCLHNEGDGGIWESFDRANAERVADALLSSGVLVDAADVRARGRADTLRELADFFMTRDGPGYVVEEICRRIEIDHHSSCDRREPSIFGNDFECCASGRCEVCSPGFEWWRDG